MVQIAMHSRPAPAQVFLGNNIVGQTAIDGYNVALGSLDRMKIKVGNKIRDLAECALSVSNNGAVLIVFDCDLS